MVVQPHLRVARYHVPVKVVNCTNIGYCRKYCELKISKHYSSVARYYSVNLNSCSTRNRSAPYDTMKVGHVFVTYINFNMVDRLDMSLSERATQSKITRKAHFISCVHVLPIAWYYAIGRLTSYDNRLLYSNELDVSLVLRSSFLFNLLLVSFSIR